MTPTYRVVIPNSVKKTLEALEEPLSSRIIDRLAALATNPRPRGAVKMAGTHGMFRLRVGDWRVVYEVRDSECVVLLVKAGIMKAGLKLLAEDEEDLAILSAHLQDAVLRVGDLAYLPKQRRFAAVVNRYCWEGCGDNEAGTRVQAGLHFDSVLRAQSSRVRQEDPAAILELLALRFTPGGRSR